MKAARCLGALPQELQSETVCHQLKWEAINWYKIVTSWILIMGNRLQLVTG